MHYVLIAWILRFIPIYKAQEEDFSSKISEYIGSVVGLFNDVFQTAFSMQFR